MMKSMWWLLAAGLFAGCNPTSPKFMEEVVVLDCDYRIACYDDAVLEFYNWTNRATCEAAATDDWNDRIAGCLYDKKVAKACLRDLEEQNESGTCPAENPELPLSCQSVGKECVDPNGGSPSNDTGDVEDTGAAE